MTDKERERSYEYYKQRQLNKNRYSHECVAYVLIFGIVLFFVLEHWQGVLVCIGMIIAGGGIYLLWVLIHKRHKTKRGLSEIENMVKAAGAKDIEVNPDNGTISFVISSEMADSTMHNIEKTMENQKYKIKYTWERNVDKEMVYKKTTDVGYVNKNNQKNNGRTEQRGTDNNQWFYNMECLNCRHKYFANGSDIKIRKCPSCQGGKP